jgi:hypothetical protein
VVAEAEGEVEVAARGRKEEAVQAEELRAALAQVKAASEVAVTELRQQMAETEARLEKVILIYFPSPKYENIFFELRTIKAKARNVSTRAFTTTVACTLHRSCHWDAIRAKRVSVARGRVSRRGYTVLMARRVGDRRNRRAALFQKRRLRRRRSLCARD